MEVEEGKTIEDGKEGKICCQRLCSQTPLQQLQEIPNAAAAAAQTAKWKEAAIAALQFYH
jgi:hypothetical protein